MMRVLKHIGWWLLLALIFPFVVPVGIWAITDGQHIETISDTVAQRIGPFATITDLRASANFYYGDDNHGVWVVDYDLRGYRHQQCLGGITVVRRVYDADGKLLPGGTQLNETKEARKGTGPVDFQGIELPTVFPLHTWGTYQLEIEARCLDADGAPVGLPAISPLIRFVATPRLNP